MSDDEVLDRLDEEVLHTLELPPETKERLHRGIPREIRIPGWVGPTLFTSELGGGRPRALRSFLRSPSGHEFAAAPVVATIRETQGQQPWIYSAFCLQPRTGFMFLVDIKPPSLIRFVNSSLDQFLRSTAVFLIKMEEVKGVAEDDLPVFSLSVRQQLEKIDPAAVNQDDSYWLAWLEEFR